jgi:hypothetical protein
MSFHEIRGRLQLLVLFLLPIIVLKNPIHVEVCITLFMFHVTIPMGPKDVIPHLLLWGIHRVNQEELMFIS